MPLLDWSKVTEESVERYEQEARENIAKNIAIDLYAIDLEHLIALYLRNCSLRPGINDVIRSLSPADKFDVYEILDRPEYHPIPVQVLFYIPSGRVQLKYKKLSENAIDPFKARPSDAGYDLSLIEYRGAKNNVHMYGTGLAFEFPQGHHAEIVPRSSIVKLGYTLANNVGIIDMGYTGEILVGLIKHDENSPELELPIRAVQMILRNTIHLPCKQVEELSVTSRGAGGFGSTGK